MNYDVFSIFSWILISLHFLDWKHTIHFAFIPRFIYFWQTPDPTEPSNDLSIHLFSVFWRVAINDKLRNRKRTKRPYRQRQFVTWSPMRDWWRLMNATKETTYACKFMFRREEVYRNPASYINLLPSVPNQKQKLRSRTNNTRNRRKDFNIYFIFNLFINMMMLVCLLMLSIVRNSLQHGYMIDPPSRSSLWRVNKKAPPNYNDNRLYCGGRSVSNLSLKTWNFFTFFIFYALQMKIKFIAFP